nr:MAG TPA: hypothetical protein [Bacteriophage sp.]DAO25916.1 MAG TPA: hypothetical protein [Caudoviricetes sp.]
MYVIREDTLIPIKLSSNIIFSTIKQRIYK